MQKKECHVGLTCPRLLWLAWAAITISFSIEAPEFLNHFKVYEQKFKTYIISFLSSNVSPKSRTSSFVSSVPFLEPTAQTNFVSDDKNEIKYFYFR